jgi:hypothetical protein
MTEHSKWKSYVNNPSEKYLVLFSQTTDTSRKINEKKLSSYSSLNMVSKE